MFRQAIPQLVRRALARHTATDTPDATLLARFVANRDADAFTELVERYAPLVWGACRRVLTDEHRAEDAFQQTFVALARKANSLRRPDRLPGWLYGVARHCALQHRGPASRGDAPDIAADNPTPLDQASGKELIAAVEAEMEKLPDDYRTAVLLCWFQDCSLDEAAKQLGTSKGRLWGRLKRAREILRQRLARRGYGLPAVLGAGLLFAPPASARLVHRTAEAARLVPADAAPLATTLPVVKVFGWSSVLAASVVGAVTLLPAAGPPAKDPPPTAPAPKVEMAGDAGFPLPPGALFRFGSRQFRHPDGIYASAISPDGKYLATQGYQRLIVWDLRTLTAKRVFNRLTYSGVDFGAGQITFLPDGRSLAVTASQVNTAEVRGGRPETTLAVVLDLETGKEKLALKGTAVYEVAAWVSAGGKELATFGSGMVRFHDPADGKQLRSVPIKDADYVRPWVAPEGDRLAVQSVIAGAAGLTLFDARTGKEIYSLPTAQVVQVALSPDGKLLVVHDATGKVTVHDPDAGKERLSFDHPAQNQMGPMRLSKDLKTLYFGGRHGQLFRWDLKNNKRLPDVGRHSTWTLSSIALSPDESVLYSMGFNKVIHRWDLKTGQQMPTPDGYLTQTTVATTPDGKRLAVLDHGGNFDFWDLASGRHVKRLASGKAGGFDCVAISPDGRWLAGGRTTQDVQLYDLVAEKVERVIPLVEKPDSKGSDHVKRVAFRADGKVLYTGSGKTGVTAWEVPSGKQLWNAPNFGPYLAVDPKGRFIAAGGGYRDRRVQFAVLDPATGEERGRIDVTPGPPGNEQIEEADPAYLADLVVAPDGSRLITSHHDGTVRLWDPETWKQRARLRDRRAMTGGLAVSPDGKLVAIGSAEYSVHVFELATEKLVLTLAGHDSEVRDVAFTRDGRGLIANADLAPTLWPTTPRDLPAVGALDAAWEGLASDDGVKAYRLVWALARDPKAAVKLLGDRVKPAEQAIERKKFDKLAADLDHPRFAVREAAEKELTALAQTVPTAWLRAARSAATSEELRTRLDRVLTLREQPMPAEWRLSRAVQALEYAGTDEARELLKAWAAAPAGSLLAVEASAAAERLGKR
jgi:RNA polymerase sigma factor (sigma-70 family)